MIVFISVTAKRKRIEYYGMCVEVLTAELWFVRQFLFTFRYVNTMCVEFVVNVNIFHLKSTLKS